MCFGTFDILHPGHLDYFKQAKKWGDYLVVVVAREKNSSRIKGRRPKHKERKRLSEIRKVKIINKAVLGFVTDMFKIIKKEKPAVVCFGYDQKVDKELIKKIKKMKIKTKRAKPYKPKKYKSHLLK